MEFPPIPPSPGTGSHALTPKQAKNYFEFFAAGSRRDVVLLGDVIEQRMHYVRSKNHKVLCGAVTGACALCLKAAESDDISVSHSEYLAPAYVRLRKGREYLQRVAVFTAVAGELVRDIAKGPQRSLRFDVVRASKQKIEIKPRGQCRCYLPPAFDLLPFVRARFGLPQDPARPLVILPPFQLTDDGAGPAQRPAALDLTPADCVPDGEQLATMKAMLARAKDAFAKPPAPAPATAAAPNGFVEVPRSRPGVKIDPPAPSLEPTTFADVLSEYGRDLTANTTGAKGGAL